MAHGVEIMGSFWEERDLVIWYLVLRGLRVYGLESGETLGVGLKEGGGEERTGGSCEGKERGIQEGYDDTSRACKDERESG